MSKSKKIVLAVLAVILTAVIALVVVNGNRRRQRANAYAEARALYHAGEFEAAAEAYDKLGDTSEARQCRQEIVVRQIQALLAKGQCDEALKLLESKDLGSQKREEFVLKIAKQMADQGDAVSAAKLVNDERAGDTRLRLSYEQLGEEQTFQAYLEEGRVAMAETSLERVEKLNASTHAKTDGELEALRAAYEEARAAADEASKREKAEAYLAEGNFKWAFDTYEALADIEGMSTAVEALLEQEGLISDTGRMNSAQAMLESLLKDGGEASLALAKRLAEGIAAECRARIDAGERSDPHFNLQRLKKWAPSLWNEDWQALMDGCTEPMPAESFIYRDTGLKVGPDSTGGTATITANNRTARGMLLKLLAIDGRSVADSDSITVFVCPVGRYTFTIRAGTYTVSVQTGFNWFGDEEGLGFWAQRENVKVMNGAKTIEQGERLEGSYSITVG